MHATPCRPLSRRAFTLVEILIVVIIIGILAAIVIPQFSNASEDARANSTRTQAQTIRSQLQLYRIEHNGNYPTGGDTDGGAVTDAWNWNKLVEKTDADGYVSAGGQYGPYLQSTPVNALNGKSAVATAVAAGVGFVFSGEAKFDPTNRTMDGLFE